MNLYVCHTPDCSSEKLSVSVYHINNMESERCRDFKMIKKEVSHFDQMNGSLTQHFI